ncbi:nucleotide pyrophosphohydrolase [Patescibacteria group bacterium]|nr:MAG: nucleotide pyrophosphohydrolase [Patescibacteria group bacterium]
MKKIESDVKQYLDERLWNNLRPGDLAKSISIEAAELLEIFQWSNPELGTVKMDNEKIEKIKKELADILIYCIDIAVLLDFDTEEIIRKKLDYIKKKYPAELMSKMKGKESGTEDAYWQIKKEHRRKNA